MTLLNIEGLHKFNTEQIMQFREVLAQRKVVVTKKVTGEAWARTRIIADANANKPLTHYVHRCQAIRDVRTFADPVDITRFDLLVPFVAEDVEETEVAKTLTVNPASREEKALLKRLILFAWSRNINHISFTDEAVNKLQSTFPEMLSTYGLSDIPLVHRGSMWSLARIAASFAILMFNTSDNKTISVEPKHIDLAREYLEQLFALWELKEYKDLEGTDQPTEEEIRKFKELMN